MKVGLIGLGVMGMNHLKTLLTLKKVEEVLVCEPDSEKIENARSDYTFRPVGGIKELLEECPDACIIATPTKYHYEIAAECLERGVRSTPNNQVQNNIKARDPYLYIKGMEIRVSHFR
jgi:virulence factor